MGVAGAGGDVAAYPWRFWLDGEPTVSAYRPAKPRAPVPPRRAGCPAVDDIGRNVLDELAWRGLVAQTTDETTLRKALADGPVTVYCGFDPDGPLAALRQPRPARRPAPSAAGGPPRHLPGRGLDRPHRRPQADVANGC